MLEFRGVYCPLATPFDHAGEIYPAKIRHNVQRLNRTRVAGFEVGGRVGEGYSLSAGERARLFGLAAEAAEDRRLLAAVTSPSLVEAVELAGAAQAAGYSAVTAQAPASAPWADALLYFRVLADRSPLPVVATLTASADEPHPRELAAHPNIAGLVDVSEDGAAGRAALAAGELAKGVLIGSEAAILESWDAGARALLVPLTNATPFHVLSIEEALRMRETEAARELIERCEPAAREAWANSGPAGLKAAMDLRGLFGGSPRPPLVAATAEQRAAVEKSLDGIAS